MDFHEKVKENYLEVISQNKPKFFKGYHFIAKLKCDSTLKLVLIIMMDDANINSGVIKWKHDTYADKLNMSRKQVMRWFNVLEKQDVIIPHKNNHSGGKQNQFSIHIPHLLKIYG